jgi:hypothetical protein
MLTLLDQALAQLREINSYVTFCAVLESEDNELRRNVHPAYRSSTQSTLLGVPPPEISRPDPLQRRTLDPDIWHGLGIVGVWAAIDAFCERKNHSPSPAFPGVVHDTLARKAPHVVDIWGDISDLRHLFAHKFAGQADDFYWFRDGPRRKNPRPHCRFSQGATVSLTSKTGTQFVNDAVRLTIQDLEFYIRQGEDILKTLNSEWP